MAQLCENGPTGDNSAVLKIACYGAAASKCISRYSVVFLDVRLMMADQILLILGGSCLLRLIPVKW